MFELIVISLIVLWSGWVILRKLWPRQTTHWLMILAGHAKRRGWNNTAKWLTPSSTAACGGCTGCAATSTDSNDTAVVIVRNH